MEVVTDKVRKVPIWHPASTGLPHRETQSMSSS